MQVSFNPVDKYGEIQSSPIAFQLTESPMKISLNINGIEEDWQFTYTATWAGIGPKTGEAVNGKIVNLSHNWSKGKQGKHLLLNVIGTCDNNKKAKLIIWGKPV